MRRLCAEHASMTTIHRNPNGQRRRVKLTTTQGLCGLLSLVIWIGGGLLVALKRNRPSFGQRMLDQDNDSFNYEPTLLQHLRWNVRASVQHDDDPCQSIRQHIVKAQTSRLTMNQLRRHTFLHYRECVPELLPAFAASFAGAFAGQQPSKQQPHRHMILHIPKTAGSSLCTFLRRATNWSVPHNSNNCFLKPYYAPTWCCYAVPQTKHTQPLSCSQQETTTAPFDVVLNENWLDPYCDNNVEESPQSTFIYSILLREPVARARSHWHHFVDRTLTNPKRPNFFNKTKEIAWRRDLIQSNYITWALTAYQHAAPHTYRPLRQHDLEHAKERLAQMDYLIDFFSGDTKEDTWCLRATLQHMGFYAGDNDQEIATLNHGPWSPSQHDNDEETLQLQTSNTLDQELYALAQQLRRADCEFFALLRETQALKPGHGIPT